jgi:membrane protease YdiL (CAAX protease family)
MTAPPAASPQSRDAIRFFAIGYAISWVLWVPVAIVEPAPAIKLPLVLLGAFGPSAAGFLLAAPAERRELIRRFVELGRIPPLWWILILAFHPLIAAAGGWIGARLGGPPVRVDWSPIATIGSAAVWLPLTLVAGPLSEEFGWRGYVQDRLQAIGGPFNASIALGIMWAMWHLPLFFIDGTQQAATRFGTWAFWMWSTRLVFLALAYTWIYNRTARSIFAVVLFHFLSNATASLLTSGGNALPTEFQIGFTIVTVLVGLLVASEWRVRANKQERPTP